MGSWQKVVLLFFTVSAVLGGGCLQITSPDPDDAALAEYLGSGSSGEDCPFAPHAGVSSGQKEIGEVSDFSVDQHGNVYLINRTSLRILDPELEVVGSWALPNVNTWRTMSVAAGEDYVAVAHFPTQDDADPDSFDDRGVLAFTPTGEPIASWEVEQVRGMLLRPTGHLVVLHDDDAGQSATVLDAELQEQHTFSVPQQGTGVREFAQCRDEFFWLDSWDHDVSGGSSRLVVTDLVGNALREWSSGAEPTKIAAGHDLVIVPETTRSVGHLSVFNLDGKVLMERSKEGPWASFGDFEIAHGMIYRVDDGVLTVQTIESFFADPPGGPARPGT